jgi:23S rRNA pseudouridine1911/1915/1917 synthase
MTPDRTPPREHRAMTSSLNRSTASASPHTNVARMQTHAFTLTDADTAMRLDQVLSRYIGALSRAEARALIAVGAVWLNNRRVHVQSRTVHAGDRVQVYIGREGWDKRYEADPGAILYEDASMLLYCKEAGVPTQSIISDDYNNLYAGLLRYLQRSTPQPYLGLHHRLDIDTTGVILFTKDKRANRSIHYQFRDRRVSKTYAALVEGAPPFQEQTLTTFIAKHDGRYRCTAGGPGREATTSFRLQRSFDGYALVQAVPHTGRTHQIRLQLAYLGHPVLGDPLYGTPAGTRTMLHAASLSFFHPVLKKTMTVAADLPGDMQRLMRTGA